MAESNPSSSERRVAHCTGRFDYTLPAGLQSAGSQQSLYLLKVSHEPLPPGLALDEFGKRRIAALAAAAAATGTVPVQVRAFDLRGVGPAAWMRLSPTRPDELALIAMKPFPDAALALFLQARASAGRESIAEGVATQVAASYAPGSAQGFCAGPGAFVIAPSKNERALESFTAPGVQVAVETETVAAPDDGQNTEGALPPGVQVLLKQPRRAAGFDGLELRVQLPDPPGADRLVYTWIFAGRAADGAAPRIRLSASGSTSHRGALDAAWGALLESLRARAPGVR